MTFKRRILAVLTRQELLLAGRELGVPVSTAMSRDELRDALAKSKLERILPELSRDRLKDACAAVGLDTHGRESKVLIDRILAASQAKDADDVDLRQSALPLNAPSPIHAVKAALGPRIQEAISARRRSSRAVMAVRRSSELESYQALRKNLFPGVPQRTPFSAAALESPEELTTAILLDRSVDVVGWVYNHRQGVDYAISYTWQGKTVPYYPDFRVRVRCGAVVHNYIVEVKGAFGHRELAKAEATLRYCELLTEHDVEPWHHLVLLENPSYKRTDVSWWNKLGSNRFADLVHHLEDQPLLPGPSRRDGRSPIEVLPSIGVAEQFDTAVPVHDLAASAGAFGSSQAPEPIGWARVRSERQLDRRMFVERVSGRSMERRVPDGSWVLFRAFEAPPMPTAIDGRRVLVQLRDHGEPDGMGAFTLKRWRVDQLDADGAVVRVSLRPDNRDFQPLTFSREELGTKEVRVIAELVEVVG